MFVLQTLGKRTDSFLETSQTILHKHNGRIILTTKKSDSYFDFETNIMGIFPMKNRKKIWLETYVHEYCHFLQKYYKTPTYKQYMKNKAGCYETIASWIFRDKIPSKKDIKEAFHLTRMLEHECEIMSVQMVNEFNLPIDKERLQRKGNAYLCFFHAVEKHRKWTTKKSIYTRSILDSMPSVIKHNYIENIPKEKLCLLEGCF